MEHRTRASVVLLTAGVATIGLLAGTVAAQRDRASTGMSFFVTSVNAGDGGNLGGLAGADAHCQKLATAVRAGGRTWRAYLSAPGSLLGSAVHARDRIGKGPWQNARGVQIAASLAELHSGRNRLAPGSALTEKGDVVPQARHDILTGSRPDGTVVPATKYEPDATCGGWTSSKAGKAMVGHSDKIGGPESWNSIHLSDGCSIQKLRPGPGDGLFYCFAT